MRTNPEQPKQLAEEIALTEDKLEELEREIEEIGEPAAHALRERLEALKVEEHALQRNYTEALGDEESDQRMEKVESLLHHIEREEVSMQHEADFLSLGAPSSVSSRLQRRRTPLPARRSWPQTDPRRPPPLALTVRQPDARHHRREIRSPQQGQRALTSNSPAKTLRHPQAEKLPKVSPPRITGERCQLLSSAGATLSSNLLPATAILSPPRRRTSVENRDEHSQNLSAQSHHQPLCQCLGIEAHPRPLPKNHR